MTALHLPQLAAAIVAATAPCLVVEVVRRAAQRFARYTQGSLPALPGVGRLRRVTLAALPPLAALALWLPPQSGWMGIIDLAAFGVLSAPALFALREIDRASKRMREIRADVRAASLAPRRVSQYLPWPARVAPYAIVAAGLLLLAWRLTVPMPARMFVVPLGFALAAGAFLFLYEAWIAGVVTGPVVATAPAEPELRLRFVRTLQIIEVVLVAIMLTVTHVLLDVDWTRHAGWAAAVALAGAVVAIVGCALALSSDVFRQAYVNADRQGA
jgi:hypothetical protein